MSKLYIKTVGKGARQIVLLHGWAMHGGIFDPLVEQLKAYATLHIVDLPGHGYSRTNSTSLEPFLCARTIAGQVPSAMWLGWSLGGLVAMAAALDMPEKVNALTVISSSPCFTSHNNWPYGTPLEVLRTFGNDLQNHYALTMKRFLGLEALGSKDAQSVAKSLEATVLERGLPDPRIYQQGMDILSDTDLHKDVRHLTMPNAWIGGSRDRLANADAMAWSAKAARGSYTNIPHAGHAAFIGFTDQVMAAILPLLESKDIA